VPAVVNAGRPPGDVCLSVRFDIARVSQRSWVGQLFSLKKYFRDIYFTQIHITMWVKLQWTDLECTYYDLKTLLPGQVRTHELLFWGQDNFLLFEKWCEKIR
jgi:hypothetical protein